MSAVKNSKMPIWVSSIISGLRKEIPISSKMNDPVSHNSGDAKICQMVSPRMRGMQIDSIKIPMQKSNAVVLTLFDADV